MMNHIPVKYKISLFLVGSLLCVMSMISAIVSALGVGPDERAAIMRGRGQLCGALAINSSVLINRREHNALETSLKAIVERNDDILSAALRSRTGRIEASSGDHKNNWFEGTTQPVETHIAVPLNYGKQQWGQLEFCFKPVYEDSFAGAWLSPMVLYLSLVSFVCLFTFAYCLGKVLKQLDPSRAVPRRVEDALNTLTEGLILTDTKGKVRLANDAFSNWIGCSSRKLIGIDPTELPWSRANDPTNSSDQSAVTCTADMVIPWSQALESGRLVAGSFLRLPNQDGKIMTLIANSSPIIGAKGKYVGVLTSFEDVTDLENHKIELSKAKETADDANRAKSDFLARMSHEIRTPMNAILGYAEVLREDLEEDPATRQKHLTTIHSSGEHLLALINDILDLSKIESGQLELERAPVSIFQVIRDVESVLKIKAQEKGIYLNCEFAEAMPVSVNADSVRLRQSIINLVGNAIKFTEEGGVTVRTALIPQSSSTALSICVTDTGVGMTEEAAQKIFEPFSQADTSITRRFGGTGLGLAICKELAEKMGGSIGVKSQPGQGSTFSLTVDVGDISGTELVSESDATLKRHDDKRTDVEVEVPPMHVLVVDDGETNVQLVSVYLRKANVSYETASNGKIAVDKVNSGDFDVVLMDMQMPVMDGFQATRLLREQGHTLPIIALTANAMAEDRKRCLDSGCSGFLTKPISRERLYKEITMAVSGKVVTQNVIASSPSENSTVASAPSEPSVPSSMEPIGSSLPMDDEDFVYVAQLFVSNLNTKIRQMVEALTSGDYDKLFRLGHWLKGSGGSAGYDLFGDPALRLEEAAKKNDLRECLSTVREICSLASRVHVETDLVSGEIDSVNPQPN